MSLLINIFLSKDFVSNFISIIIVIITILSIRHANNLYKSLRDKISNLTVDRNGFYPTQLDDQYHISVSNGMVLCTLLGLIGTFYGMTDALTSIFANLSNHVTSDEVQAGKDFVNKAKSLLGGMGTAFGTSLVGIFCSIVLSIFGTYLNNQLSSMHELAKQKFENLIDPYFQELQQIRTKMPQSSQDDILNILQTISGQFTRLFVQLNQKEESAINALLENLKREVLLPMSMEIRQSNQNSKILHENLSDFSVQIKQQMQETQKNINHLISANQLTNQTNQEILKNHQSMMQENHAFLSHLKSILNDISHLENVFHNVAMSVEHQMKSLTTEVDKQLKSAFATVPQIIEKTRLEQQKALEAFQEQYKNSFDTIYKTHENSIKLLASGFKSFLDKYQIQFQASLETMSAQITQSAQKLLNDAGEEIKISLSKVPNMLEKTTNESIALMRNLGSEIDQQFAEQRKEFKALFNDSRQAIANEQTHLKSVSKDIHDHLTNSRNEFEVSFKEMSKNVAEEAAKLLANASDELEKGLQSVPNLLVQTRKETIEELTRFKNHYQEELSFFFNQQTSHLHQQKESFSQLHHSIQSSLNQVRQDFEHILNQVAVQVVEHTSDMLKQASIEVENGLRSVPEMLEKTRQETQLQLTQFRQEYQDRLNAFFSAQNDVLDETLGRHHENLSRVIDRLQTTFRDEADRRSSLYVQMDENVIKLQQSAERVSRMQETLSHASSAMLPQISMASQEIGKRLEQAYTENIRLQEHIQLLHHQFQEDIKTFGNTVGQITKELNGLMNKSDVYAAQLIEGLGHTCHLITQKIEELQQVSKIKN
jgi:hypothetical protein